MIPGAFATGLAVAARMQRADALIQQVLGAQGVYDALGMARDATIDEVRKVYRKVCLRVHPDKCKVCARSRGSDPNPETS